MSLFSDMRDRKVITARQAEHGHPVLDIKRAGRLVEQEQFRPPGHRAGTSHAPRRLRFPFAKNEDFPRSPIRTLTGKTCIESIKTPI
ncbi:hypothetical protein ACFFP0_01250 [Rhizobium puerariae]|uniref:Uncharacterized protein n=1 Tax=Rhizobium puerariae TaxID=1585791 RepID=A0ABV6AA47_9HYPH